MKFPLFFLVTLVYNIAMKNKSKIPDWVLSYQRKGTTIKHIGENYYLYSATSKYTKEKPYPVSIQKYIGKITPSGIVVPERISFTPGKDEIIRFEEAFSLDVYTSKDRELLRDIPLIKVDGRYYTGSLSSLLIKKIMKHFQYNNGEVSKYELREDE